MVGEIVLSDGCIGANVGCITSVTLVVGIPKSGSTSFELALPVHPHPTINAVNNTSVKKIYFISLLFVAF
jgi:hypothetical protein